MPSPNVPLGVGEVAKLLGWDTRRTSRWLDGLAEGDPSIIVRVRGRRMTTLALLRRVCPDVAKRFAMRTEVDQVQSEQENQGEEIHRIASSLGRLRENSRESIEAVKRRLDRLELANSDNKRSR